MCWPLVAEIFRVHGGFDTFLGYSFTPDDSGIYRTGNLIPPNLTFGGWGYVGLEFFVSRRTSVFIQSGGGFKTLLVEDNTSPYAVASSWLGSGFGIEVGTTVYF